MILIISTEQISDHAPKVTALPSLNTGGKAVTHFWQFVSNFKSEKLHLRILNKFRFNFNIERPTHF